MTKKRKIAVGLGELLWDMLPGGKQLGGAPFNFARHCAQLGLDAFPVSQLGTDRLGDETIDLLNSWEVNIRYVYRDPEHPTGTVEVELDDKGKPSYQIRECVAWDFLTMSREMEDLAPKVDAVCFGSLAQRNSCSRETISAFIDRMRPDALKLFDVNLRQHYYTMDTLEQSLRRASILKLSDEELTVLGRLFTLSGSVVEKLEGLLRTFDLKLTAYTRGAHGSLLVDETGISDHPGLPVAGIDTIGAGDSFSATLCAGLLDGLPIDRINENANRVATFVCSRSGATPDLPRDLINSVSNHHQQSHQEPEL